MGDGKTKPGAHVLAGAQRFEELSELATVHPLPFIGNVDLDRAVYGADGKTQSAAARHGLKAVARQIPEHLHQLVLGDGDPQRILVGQEDDLMIGPTLGAYLNQADGVGKNRVQVAVDRGTLGSDVPQVGGDGGGQAVDLLRDDAKEALLILGYRGPFRLQMGCGAECTECVPDFLV